MMDPEAAIWLGSTAFSAKLTVSGWLAAVVLLSCDSRRSAVIWQILCLLLAMFAAVASSLEGPAWMVWSWRGVAAVAACTLVLHTNRWLHTDPGQLHAEAAVEDAPVKKKSKQRAAGKSSKSAASATSTSADSTYWLQWSGLLAAAAILAIALFGDSARGWFRWVVIGHTLATATALGVSVACAFELTFISSPTATRVVRWWMMASTGLVCWLISLLCVTAVLVWPPESRDASAAAIVVLFSLSMLVVNSIVWYIPYRLSAFSARGTTSDWVSLTMAAWICVLSLAVVLALPFRWPWMV